MAKNLDKSLDDMIEAKFKKNTTTTSTPNSTSYGKNKGSATKTFRAKGTAPYAAQNHGNNYSSPYGKNQQGTSGKNFNFNHYNTSKGGGGAGKTTTPTYYAYQPNSYNYNQQGKGGKQNFGSFHQKGKGGKTPTASYSKITFIKKNTTTAAAGTATEKNNNKPVKELTASEKVDKPLDEVVQLALKARKNKQLNKNSTSATNNKTAATGGPLNKTISNHKGLNSLAQKRQLADRLKNARAKIGVLKAVKGAGKAGLKLGTVLKSAIAPKKGKGKGATITTKGSTSYTGKGAATSKTHYASHQPYTTSGKGTHYHSYGAKGTTTHKGSSYHHAAAPPSPHSLWEAGFNAGRMAAGDQHNNQHYYGEPAGGPPAIGPPPGKGGSYGPPPPGEYYAPPGATSTYYGGQHPPSSTTSYGPPGGGPHHEPSSYYGSYGSTASGPGKQDYNSSTWTSSNGDHQQHYKGSGGSTNDYGYGKQDSWGLDHQHGGGNSTKGNHYDSSWDDGQHQNYSKNNGGQTYYRIVPRNKGTSGNKQNYPDSSDFEPSHHQHDKRYSNFQQKGGSNKNHKNSGNGPAAVVVSKGPVAVPRNKDGIPHSLSKFKNSGKLIQIANCPIDIARGELQKSFEDIGKTLHTELCRVTQIAWIAFADKKCAGEALAQYDGGEMNGRTIKVTLV
ncbi:unnamed protein product [Amoebophrya sp. A120]|nr:unnamed protein product [Amoebophrya sp. A120]|eukprot:GSA120T00014510001.1